MTRVVEVPAQFDDRSFDQFARSFGESDGKRLLFDAHAAQWASPYGLLGLLAAGQAAVERGPERPLLTVPADRDVAHYWGRAGFFQYAQEWFELHGKVPRVAASHSSDVLLEITPVHGTDDVHSVVETIQERSAAILSGELGLEATATMGFAMALSEACQNIVEHAGTSGWVAVQAYHWRKRLGRRVVVIAVADAGIGFRTPSGGRSNGSRSGPVPDPSSICVWPSTTRLVTRSLRRPVGSPRRRPPRARRSSRDSLVRFMRLPEHGMWTS